MLRQVLCHQCLLRVQRVQYEGLTWALCSSALSLSPPISSTKAQPPLSFQLTTHNALISEPTEKYNLHFLVSSREFESFPIIGKISWIQVFLLYLKHTHIIKRWIIKTPNVWFTPPNPHGWMGIRSVCVERAVGVFNGSLPSSDWWRRKPYVTCFCRGTQALIMSAY